MFNKLETPAKAIAYATLIRLIALVVMGGVWVIPSALGTAITMGLQIYTIHCVSRGKCRTWAWTMAIAASLGVVMDLVCALAAVNNGIRVSRRWAWAEEKVVKAAKKSGIDADVA